ncbi:MAG: dihydrofolate reductase, partial [Oscillospiraceae bacterium]|nr:dihydrofolate reductase [Oscillospiraceae bacterium]
APSPALPARGRSFSGRGTGSAPAAWLFRGGRWGRRPAPFCDAAYVTKVHVTPESDTFFPNLDEDKDWYLAETLQSGEENGIAYEMCLYRRK